ncbi:MAG TPA: FAD-dependent oxidoreductase, partial [Actinoallomurus sp.]
MEIRTDALVVGGGLGGVAAALALLKAGSSVVLTEEYDWLGGQLTSQAVPP